MKVGIYLCHQKGGNRNVIKVCVTKYALNLSKKERNYDVLKIELQKYYDNYHAQQSQLYTSYLYAQSELLKSIDQSKLNSNEKDELQIVLEEIEEDDTL